MKDLYRLRNMPLEIADRLTAYRERKHTIAHKQRGLHLHSTLDDRRRAQSEEQAELEEARRAALEGLDALGAEMTRERDALLAEVDAHLREPKATDPTKALLQELREQRTWARLARILDRAEDTAKAAHDLATAAQDLHTLGVLADELPSYLASRNLSHSMPVIAHALEERVASISPDAKLALDRRAEALKGTNRVQVGIQHVKHTIETDAPSVVIPGWDANDPPRTVDMTLPAMP